MIYSDIYDGPPRWYTATVTRKKYIMIHATANTASAEAEASYAKRRPDRTSSHYYVDDDSIVQSLDTDYRAWHAGNTEGNDAAIAYELTARNMDAGRAWWLDLDNIEWPLMVGAIARDCRHHHIEARDLTVAQLRAGALTGFCMHFEGNEAWGGSDHTDPGPNFPMDHLVSQVRAAMEDDVSGTQVWGHPIVNPDSRVTMTAEQRLLDIERKGGTAVGLLAELQAGQAAIQAHLIGEDVEATVRAELDRHRELLVRTFGPELAAEVASELRDVPAEVVEAAVTRAGERLLERTRLAVEQSADSA